MAAMAEELAAVIGDLRDVRVETVAGRPFHVGTLHGVDVVLVTSRIGKVAAATTATLLLERFAARAVIFVGVAGGAAAHVQVGDVVLAERVTQHDLDVRPIFPRFELPGHGVSALSPPRRWLTHGEAAVTRALAEIPRALGETTAALALAPPRLHRGLLASGDQFLAEASATRALVDALPGLLAVEMEGAAVAQVAFEHGAPWLVVRTISDSADHGSAAAFPIFLERAVGPYARVLVRELLRDLPA
jgi:adenosylhomocysteine nucleosidase